MAKILKNNDKTNSKNNIYRYMYLTYTHVHHIVTFLAVQILLHVDDNIITAQNGCTIILIELDGTPWFTLSFLCYSTSAICKLATFYLYQILKTW